MFGVIKETKIKIINYETREEVHIKKGDIVKIKYYDDDIYRWRFWEHQETEECIGRIDYINDREIKLDFSKEYESHVKYIRIDNISDIEIIKRKEDMNE